LLQLKLSSPIISLSSMAFSYDKRESLIDEVSPESVSKDQINKISMGIYSDEHLQEKAIDSLVDIS
jgi:hypothetical protein